MSATTTTRVSADILGMRHDFLATKDQTDGSLSVVAITVPPGAGVPSHTKTREGETYYVIEGALSVVRGTEPVHVSAGEVIFIPPNEMQTWVNQGEVDARVLLIFTPGGGEGFLLDLAEAMPAEAPDGPPPPEALEALAQIGARYGIEMHVE